MGKKQKKSTTEALKSRYEEPGDSVDAGNNGANLEPIDLTDVREILSNALGDSGNNNGGGDKTLIAILQKTQEAYGYIPKPVLREISRQTGVSASKIFGIVTFYDEFSTERRGKYTIKACCGTACQVKGGKKSLETVKNKLGIEAGQTTEDYEFSLETVGCLGACAIAPAMLVNTQLYGRATEEKIEPIIEQLSEKSSKK